MKIKKHIIGLLMFVLVALGLFGCGKAQEPKNQDSALQSQSSRAMSEETQPHSTPSKETQPPQGESKSAGAIDKGGSYTAKEDVALYLHSYHQLPGNFITKKEANALGWSGGSLEKYAPGKCIGGDRFGNYEGRLPADKTYYECDIDTLGASQRGAKRIVYTKDGDIYYTQDHYETFEKLY